jgi:hypothetical protein
MHTKMHEYASQEVVPHYHMQPPNIRKIMMHFSPGTKQDTETIHRNWEIIIGLVSSLAFLCSEK